MMEKLELKHLAPYLPYGLKCVKQIYKNGDCQGFFYMSPPNIIQVIINVNNNVENKSGFPVLRSLSDYADINSSAMSNLNTDLTIQIEIVEFAHRWRSLYGLSFEAYICLISDHADVFNLIEKGLAISINDINTLKETL